MLAIPQHGPAKINYADAVLYVVKIECVHCDQGYTLIFRIFCNQKWVSSFRLSLSDGDQ